MRLTRRYGIRLLLMAFASRLPAQLQLITFDYSFKVRKLAGITLDPIGTEVPFVSIADCDSSFKKVVATVTTDLNGRFKFPNSRFGATHYLRISKDGFDPMQMKVELTPKGEPELKIKMTIAT